MKINGGARKISYPINNNLPIVSVIIVTFNADQYLQHCIDSIKNQSFQNIELLIFDGESTDRTLEIITSNEQYISYWQSEGDAGIYDAMNKAVKQAIGQWIFFLGADDVLLDGFSKMANKLLKADTLYYGYCYRNNLKTNGKLSNYEVAKVNVCHHAAFYPAAVFKKYQYNTKYIVYADHALNIQCWGDRYIKKKYFPFAIADYNADGFSTKTEDEFFKKEKLNWIKKYMSKYVYIRYCIRKWKESKRKRIYFF